MGCSRAAHCRAARSRWMRPHELLTTAGHTVHTRAAGALHLVAVVVVLVVVATVVGVEVLEMTASSIDSPPVEAGPAMRGSTTSARQRRRRAATGMLVLIGTGWMLSGCGAQSSVAKSSPATTTTIQPAMSTTTSTSTTTSVPGQLSDSSGDVLNVTLTVPLIRTPSPVSVGAAAPSGPWFAAGCTDTYEYDQTLEVLRLDLVNVGSTVLQASDLADGLTVVSPSGAPLSAGSCGSDKYATTTDAVLGCANSTSVVDLAPGDSAVWCPIIEVLAGDTLGEVQFAPGSAFRGSAFATEEIWHEPIITPPAVSSTTTPMTPALTGVESCVVASAAPEIRPTTIVFGCATASDGVKAISWASWTLTRATGTGTLYVDTCRPFCAAGKTDTYDHASVRLTDPVISGGHLVYRDVTVTTGMLGLPCPFIAKCRDGSMVVSDSSPGGGWGYD